MKKSNLDDMLRGWFVGPFSPVALSTNACEVAVKKYVAGDKEAPHFHKISTEVTVILSGRIYMCERHWSDGDIIVLEPGEITSFEAFTNATCVVVKIPGVADDKYPAFPMSRD